MLMDPLKFGNPKSTFLEIRQPGQAQNLKAFPTKQNNETNSIPPLRLFIEFYMEHEGDGKKRRSCTWFIAKVVLNLFA